MDVEPSGDSGRHQMGRFGFPRENPETLVPMDPEMKKGMAAVNAHIDAQNAKAEPNLHTAEGRKKAAEAELAERQRKENDWLSRVIYDRGDGWKPIWGTAEDQELRIYTLAVGGAHRFWGIKPIGMGIDDFWDKYDPEVRRCEDRQQETPVNPDAPTGSLIGEPLRSSPPSNKAAANPRKRQKLSEVNPTHRVQKSNIKSAKDKKITRKSLTHKVDAGHPKLEDQIQEAPVAEPTNDRSPRKKTAIIESGAHQESVTENGGSTTKRPRGRPPTKGILVEKSSKQKKTTAVKGNARVTKSQRKKQHLSAPSTHKMRTRAKGPANLLQLP